MLELVRDLLVSYLLEQLMNVEVHLIFSQLPFPVLLFELDFQLLEHLNVALRDIPTVGFETVFP